MMLASTSFKAELENLSLWSRKVTGCVVLLIMMTQNQKYLYLSYSVAAHLEWVNVEILRKNPTLPFHIIRLHTV